MSISQRLKNSIVGGLLAASLTTAGGAAALAQDATPEGTPAATPVAEEEPAPLKASLTLINVDGDPIAFAAIEEVEGGVTVTVASSEDTGLAPGEHGIHLHEVGVCDASGDEPFSSAGAHYNPTGSTHGGPDTDPRHAGDLGNLTVNDDGTINFEVTVEGLSLAEGDTNSLDDIDGSALIISFAA
jgi:Cu-Zn family superoxide dismutase